MNALETEYHRLYCAPEGLVRALVLDSRRFLPRSPGCSRNPVPAPASAARYQEPRSFLWDVMNDPSTELRLRIEAAKALLPYVER